MSNTIGQPAGVEQRITALEEAVKAKKKDGWDKAQVLAGFLSSVVIAGVGLWVNAAIQKQLKEGQIAQTQAEIETNREKSDTEIRARMFDTLIPRFFKGDLPGNEKLILLSLIQSNFQEFFNARPLFEMIDRNSTEKSAREKLRKFAQAMTERQELALGAGLGPPQTVKLNQPVNVIVGTHGLNIELIEIAEDRVKVRVKAAKPDELHFREIEFEVDYFDMPFMDNTKLPDGHRFSVTLKGIDAAKKTAELKIFEFDHDYIGSQDRPALQQLKHLADRTARPDMADHEHGAGHAD